jgi:hypothetical protein
MVTVDTGVSLEPKMNLEKERHTRRFCTPSGGFSRWAGNLLDELQQGHITGEAFWKNEGPGRMGHSPTKAKP